MKIRTILIIMAMLFTATVVLAVESQLGKPESHDTTWERSHGKASLIDNSECMACHVDQISCIYCHEDKAPRSHNSAWVKKGHGLQSKWNRSSCAVCHTDSSFCEECHQATPPDTHRAGWGGQYGGARHCTAACHGTISTFKSNPRSQSCAVCHSELPNNGSHLQ